MAQQSITVTFPTYIPSDLVISSMQDGIKNIGQCEAQCHFQETDGKENTFLIWADKKEVFYYAGMVAYSLLDAYTKKMRQLIKQQ